MRRNRRRYTGAGTLLLISMLLAGCAQEEAGEVSSSLQEQLEADSINVEQEQGQSSPELPKVSDPADQGEKAEAVDDLKNVQAEKEDEDSGISPPVSVKEEVYEGSKAAGDKQNSPSLDPDRTVLSWYYMKKGQGKVPDFPRDTRQYSEKMKALWVGTGKKIYLTIDAGGPLGDTETLLKALKDNNAKANFFIAGYNVKKDPEFIRQLVQDGHLVANHTMTHKDMNDMTDDEVRQDIEQYAALYKEVTGEEIELFFRFPYGRYSKHLLELVSEMGYTSVFWSTAMRDWEPRPNGAEDPYNDIMNNLHDGNIILMHQGSPENIEALDRIIREIQALGYEFALLSEMEAPE